MDAVSIAFVDDLALVAGARNGDTLVKHTNKCLFEISKWMKNRLSLAPEKTEAAILNRKRDRERVWFVLEEANKSCPERH